MRELYSNELQDVAGADWSVELNGGLVKVVFSGDEDVQDIGSAVATIASDAYWGARDTMADFYEWAANGWNYSMACAYQYY
ncbi:MAG: hypothetical protein ACO1PZ_03445 [Gammaproteobacteria bacterium]